MSADAMAPDSLTQHPTVHGARIESVEGGLGLFARDRQSRPVHAPNRLEVALDLGFGAARTDDHSGSGEPQEESIGRWQPAVSEGEVDDVLDRQAPDRSGDRRAVLRWRQR